MAARQSREFRYWANVIIGSCFAAAIAAVGGVCIVLIEQAKSSDTKRCEIAAGILHDETPSPYVENVVLKRLGDRAAKRVQRCLED